MKRLVLALFAGLLLIGSAEAQPRKVVTPSGRTYFTGRKPLPPAIERMIHAKAAARHGNLVAKLPKVTAAQFDARTLGWVPPIRDQGQCGSCMPKGTLILMGDETQRPIEEVRVGDVVVSAEGALCRVVLTPRRYTAEPLLHVITADGANVKVTPTHAIRTKDRYIEARYLLPGDLVALVKSSTEPQWTRVVDVIRGPPHNGIVYDLKTDNNRSFVANSIGAHNCWDFSGSAVVSSALIKAGQIPNTSNCCSEQYTLDCGQNGGCGGDDNITVLQWAKATGLPLDKDYGGYTASSGRCKYTTSMKLYKITDWGFCTPNQQSGVASTDDIKKCLVAYGPIGLGIDAGVLGDGTGIVSGSGHSIDHDVVVVGWDDSKGRSGCWIMKNSWGTSWGQACGGIEGGYCYIEYGSGDIGTEACWAQAQAVGPPPPPPSPWILRVGFGLPNPYQQSVPCCGAQAQEEPKRSGPDYSATISTSRTFGPGEFGNRFVGITAKIDTQLPAGEYKADLTKTSGKQATCRCGGDPTACQCGATCTCANGGDCRTQAKYDTKTIWRDPETGNCWRYTDQQGNVEVVPDPARVIRVEPVYQQQSYFVPSFGGFGGGRACST